MNEKSNTIAEVCDALATNRKDIAADILRERYPFVPLENAGHHYSIKQTLGVFIRDGFTDRYSGSRLILPAALRLISKMLPDEFPYQTNWRTDACHFAYYELSATIDHNVPVSRGGNDDDSNWMTTSMARNFTKANFTLDELGWSLQPPGDINKWDGLMGWFIAQEKLNSSICAEPYFQRWLRAIGNLQLS
jgi:hypothetical protein